VPEKRALLLLDGLLNHLAGDSFRPL
jgi:hypothetical protein